MPINYKCQDFGSEKSWNENLWRGTKVEVYLKI